MLKKKLYPIYKKNSEGYIINVAIPFFLGSIPLIAKLIDIKYEFVVSSFHIPVSIPVGVLAIGLLTLHSYILKVVKGEKINLLEYWQKKSLNYSWLITSIEKLVNRKVGALMRGVGNPIKFNEESVWKNLQMLYEFYVYYAMDPGLRLKMVFFTPSIDGNYLTSLFWYNIENQPPDSHKNDELQKNRFNRGTSTTLAVKTWKSRETEVAECGKEITQQYTGQLREIKSIIAYPITGQGSKVVGIITVSANKEYFFRRSEIATHEEFIRQTGIRIALELSRLNNSTSAVKKRRG